MTRRVKPDKTPAGRLIGYARVSTIEQNLDMQTEALRKAGVHPDLILVEKVSASARRRPKFEWMIDMLRPGDTVVVWRLDRLGRDVRGVLKTIDTIRESGADFKSLTETFDTTTPFGNFGLTLTAAYAQLERDGVIFRTKTGVDAARRRGVRFGQPPKLTKEQRKQCRDWARKDGLTVREIVKRVTAEFKDGNGKRIKKIAHGTVHKYINQKD